MKSLLIDFGASRIKAGVSDPSSVTVTDVRIWPSCHPCDVTNGKFEISPSDILRLFHDIVSSFRHDYHLAAILVCSEMHGFLIADDNNRPLGNYISWKDERDVASGGQCFARFSSVFSGDRYLQTTGMFLSAASPVINMLHALGCQRSRTIRILSLTDLLATSAKDDRRISHISLSAGMGIVDACARAYCGEIRDFIYEATTANVTGNEIVSKVECTGFIDDIPMYTGIGDLQSALYGAGNDEGTCSVNLGTGSQVSIVNGASKGLDIEFRPYVDDRTFQTITHIPSGRAINCFMGFLSSINPKRDFWDELGKISEEEIKSVPQQFDLGVFSGSWRGVGCGSISGILENSWDVKTYLAAMLKSYVKQYVDAISMLRVPRNRTIVMSGGVASHLPVVGKMIGQWTGLPVKMSQSREETLDGLAMLATKTL